MPSTQAFTRNTVNVCDGLRMYTAVTLHTAYSNKLYGTRI